MSSLGRIEWVLLTDDAVSVGDAVSADAGGMPIYRVVDVVAGEAWLLEDDHPDAKLMPIGGLRWKAVPTKGDSRAQ